MIISYNPIGYVSSPIKSRVNAPIQSIGAGDVNGYIEVREDLVEGLIHLEGFSHIYVIYHFHRTEDFKLLCQPFLDDEAHGVFATRAPNRPNPIGISVVKLNEIVNNKVYISSIDMLDGTPVLDIKPYIEKFDSFLNTKNGWLEKNLNDVKTYRSDNRFVK